MLEHMLYLFLVAYLMLVTRSCLLLPSDMSKMFVYRKYREAATDPVGKSKFFELWDELTPHVAVMKPSSDTCFTCQQNNQLILKSVNMPEAFESRGLIMHSKGRRHYYRTQFKEAETTWSAHLENQESVDTMHYSMTLPSKCTFLLTHNKPDPLILKPPTSVEFLVLSAKERPSK